MYSSLHYVEAAGEMGHLLVCTELLMGTSMPLTSDGKHFNSQSGQSRGCTVKVDLV